MRLLQPRSAIPTVPDVLVHLSDRHFRLISEFIEAQVGIKLPAGKRLMLEGRLQKRVRALNYSDLNEYVDDLFDGGDLRLIAGHAVQRPFRR